MPSFGIHLAVANLYLKKHLYENPNDFIKGTIDVDCVLDKKKSHYTGNPNKANLEQYLKQKVLLYEYVKENTINTSYDRGYFLHLLTDYYFYTDYLDIDWVRKTDYQTFRDTMYHDYKVFNGYLARKYNFEYPNELKEFSKTIKDKPMVLSKKSLDRFIVEMASLNLEDVYHSNKIKVYKK